LWCEWWWWWWWFVIEWIGTLRFRR
jgi:hypothetical protein